MHQVPYIIPVSALPSKLSSSFPPACTQAYHNPAFTTCLMTPTSSGSLGISTSTQPSSTLLIFRRVFRDRCVRPHPLSLRSPASAGCSIIWIVPSALLTSRTLPRYAVVPSQRVRFAYNDTPPVDDSKVERPRYNVLGFSSTRPMIASCISPRAVLPRHGDVLEAARVGRFSR